VHFVGCLGDRIHRDAGARDHIMQLVHELIERRRHAGNLVLAGSIHPLGEVALALGQVEHRAFERDERMNHAAHQQQRPDRQQRDRHQQDNQHRRRRHTLRTLRPGQSRLIAGRDGIAQPLHHLFERTKTFIESVHFRERRRTIAGRDLDHGQRLVDIGLHLRGDGIQRRIDLGTQRQLGVGCQIGAKALGMRARGSNRRRRTRRIVRQFRRHHIAAQGVVHHVGLHLVAHRLAVDRNVGGMVADCIKRQLGDYADDDGDHDACRAQGDQAILDGKVHTGSSMMDDGK